MAEFTRKQLTIIFKIAFLEAMALSIIMPSVTSSGELSGIFGCNNSTSLIQCGSTSCSVITGLVAPVSCSVTVNFASGFKTIPNIRLNPSGVSGPGQGFSSNALFSTMYPFILEPNNQSGVVLCAGLAFSVNAVCNYSSNDTPYATVDNVVAFLTSQNTNSLQGSIIRFCFIVENIGFTVGTETLRPQKSTDQITWTDVDSSFTVNVSSISGGLQCLSKVVSGLTGGVLTANTFYYFRLEMAGGNNLANDAVDFGNVFLSVENQRTATTELYTWTHPTISITSMTLKMVWQDTSATNGASTTYTVDWIAIE